MSRQTHDVIQHPHRGQCTVVHNNGPTFLLLADGTQIPLSKPITTGCHYKEGPYVVFHDPDHGEVKARGIKSGEVHRRKVHAMFGAGWLVYGDEGEMRFDTDHGPVLRFKWNSISVGTPQYALKSKKHPSKALPMTAEEREWMTYVTTEGETISFRNETSLHTVPPSAQATTSEPRGKQPKLPGIT